MFLSLDVCTKTLRSVILHIVLSHLNASTPSIRPSSVHANMLLISVSAKSSSSSTILRNGALLAFIPPAFGAAMGELPLLVGGMHVSNNSTRTRK